MGGVRRTFVAVTSALCLSIAVLPLVPAHAVGSASVSGRVTGAAGGAPLESAEVTIEKSGVAVATGQSDLNGEYEIGGLDAGAYTVRFDAVDAFHVTTTTSVKLTAAEVRTGVNAALEFGGELTGSLTAWGGTPLDPAARLTVRVHSYDYARNVWSLTPYTGVVEGNTFHVRGLPTAPTLHLEFVDSAGIYTRQFYRNALTVDAGDWWGVYPGLISTTRPVGLLPAQQVVNFRAPDLGSPPSVGLTNYAYSGEWSPLGVSLAYQWFSDGVPIVGATARGYVPTQSQIGSVLTVEVTGTMGSAAPVTVVAGPSEAIAPMFPFLPRPFKVAARSANSVTMSWLHQVGAQGYELTALTDGKVVTRSAVGPVGRGVLTGLRPGTQYTVKGVTKSLEGVASVPSTVTVATLPATAKGLKVSKIKKSSALLAWKNAEGAERYQVTCTRGKSVRTVKAMLWGERRKSVTTFKLQKLRKNTTYRCQVRSYANNGDGAQLSKSVVFKSKKR